MIPGMGDLTLARADRALMMDKTCQVQAYTETPRPGGGQAVGTWTTVANGTQACNKYQRTRATEEQLVAGVPGVKLFFDVYLPYTEAVLALGITSKHRLLVDGQLLNIEQAPTPDSHDLDVYILASISRGQ